MTRENPDKSRRNRILFVVHLLLAAAVLVGFVYMQSTHR
jgi:predicted negative regulator of RcsB-dependent stress response